MACAKFYWFMIIKWCMCIQKTIQKPTNGKINWEKSSKSNIFCWNFLHISHILHLRFSPSSSSSSSLLSYKDGLVVSVSVFSPCVMYFNSDVFNALLSICHLSTSNNMKLEEKWEMRNSFHNYHCESIDPWTWTWISLQMHKFSFAARNLEFCHAFR